MSKCSFIQSAVEYLEHIISAEGMAADPKKVECMVTWPRPKSVKQLRGFLGLTSYYRKFVRAYGAIAKPLTELLKKDNFKGNEEADKAFKRMKSTMSTTPVLALPNFKEPFTVEIDACHKGTGAVLIQGRDH
ncbi:hypothetical protein ACH5RR_000379 [Cinchona calisaya]|uniref:Reverse transcriptase/retrotransposon-derived protein RNase H-like domain-containing protein n=1 Tax=Cinchona calisaya TaxID=153742 RepID=A0ABD3B106_9GENT